MKAFLYDNREEQSKRDFYEKLKALEPGEYVVSIKKNRPARSLNANKYYHAVLNIISIDTGHTHEQLHEICKRKFNSEVIYLPKGGSEIFGQSTSKLDVQEFASYVNRVKQWAIDEFNIVIPEQKDVDLKRWMDIQNTYDDNNRG
jgi:hypothetical protein